MGRWGKGIYDGDSPLDYFMSITDRIEREIEYWVSPEQVANNGWWLSQVLTVMEIILLFEQHNIGLGGVPIRSNKLVQRWRSAFMPVWDTEWKVADNYPIALDDYAYRQKHRPAIETMFKHLEDTGYEWENLGEKAVSITITPLLAEYSLPYFSIRMETNQLGQESSNFDRFIGSLIEQLVKDIIYFLSSETRWEAFGFYRLEEDLPVAIDILGLLCEAYQTDPVVKHKDIKLWRATTMEIIRQNANEYGGTEDSEQYANISAAFDRLEAVAQKYPPFDWGI
ncbi:MAG: hypothetical protein LCI00_12605 [Chloroflexi bacterium]|nr:hypothetical protein [Chloroflexota bacterium]MCC6891959.1 hypothetical protein [Anaerolineae bacterium]